VTPTAPRIASLTLRDGLVLLAPGGVFVPAARALVVADTHAGLPSELRSRGHAVPHGDDEALYARVRGMLDATGADTLVVAGDLAHGPGAARSRPGSPSALRAFVQRFERSTLRVALGNHDRGLAPALDALGVEHGDTLLVGPHAVTHGDVPDAVAALRAQALARGGRVLLGHLHPAVTLDDGAGARAVCPAFVSARGLLCLPALSPWSRGVDVRRPEARARITALAPTEPMGAAVVIGDAVLPVGDVFSAARSPRDMNSRA
jgi:putative SbcD/Mre11-related phosphoesterase